MLLAALALVALALPAAAQTAPPAAERMTPIVRVARDVGPAVVNVYQEVVSEVELPPPFDRMFAPRRDSSLGSGFIIDADGYILTNAHVLQASEQGILVRLGDGTTYPAQRVSVDTESDVALLKIKPDPDKPLTVATLGTSSDLMVGETVVAIGNPLGNENSVSSGIVSSVFRDLRLPTSSRRHAAPAFKDYIQIDAPINPGNSGGPLLNVLGEVIGINFLIASDAEGIGFAIPIDRVRKSLMTNLLNPQLQREIVTGLEIAGDHSGRHVALAHVAPDGPADRAGLRAGDELVEVSGRPIRREFDFNKALLSTRPGDKVPVVVRRDGSTVRAEIELGASEESPVLCIWRTLGLAVVDHPRYKGVRVERVDPGGPGAVLGIQAGDLVDGIGDRPIDSSIDLYGAVRGLPAGTRVTVHVWRGGMASVGELRLR
jgi:serine protease Do